MDTLKYYEKQETVDVFAEIGFGTEKELSFPLHRLESSKATKEFFQNHITNTFLQFYQKGCFKKPVDGRCLANFPNSRFHNIDFRQTLKGECDKVIRDICEVYGMFSNWEELNLFFSKIKEDIQTAKNNLVKSFLQNITKQENKNKKAKPWPDAPDGETMGQRYTRLNIEMDEQKLNTEQRIDYIAEKLPQMMAENVKRVLDSHTQEYLTAHASALAEYLNNYDKWTSEIIFNLYQLASTLPKEKEKERSLYYWIHYMVSLKKELIKPLNFIGNPLEHYDEVLTYLDPFCDPITFLKLLNHSMMMETESNYFKEHNTLPYYQYRLEKMIKKTDPSIQPSLNEAVRHHLLSMRIYKKGAERRILEKMSGLMDLFFIVRLFENFKVVPNQPSGPITRVIAYVGSAHVERIEKVLRAWAEKSRAIEYTDHNSYVTRIEDSRLNNIGNLAQCITIPLQEIHQQAPTTENNPYGSSLVLPETLNYADIDRHPASFVNESRKYIVKNKLQLLNIDIDISIKENKKRYEMYLKLPMYAAARFNTLLDRANGDGEKVKNLFELLDNNNVQELTEMIDAMALSEGLEFSFGKKKAKKSAKKAKKSVKKAKKSVKKAKKSVKKTKKSVKNAKKSVKKI